CALAAFDPAMPRWSKAGPGVVADLLAEEPRFVQGWQAPLRPVRLALLPPLGRVFRTRDKPVERSLATTILADYAADQVEVLADLTLDADPKQFAVLWPVLQSHGAARSLMEQAAQVPVSQGPAVPEEDKERTAKRQANAVVALLKMG